MSMNRETEQACANSGGATSRAKLNIGPRTGSDRTLEFHGFVRIASDLGLAEFRGNPGYSSHTASSGLDYICGSKVVAKFLGHPFQGDMICCCTLALSEMLTLQHCAYCTCRTVVVCGAKADCNSKESTRKRLTFVTSRERLNFERRAWRVSRSAQGTIFGSRRWSLGRSLVSRYLHLDYGAWVPPTALS